MEHHSIAAFRDLITTARESVKCRKCACMQEALRNIRAALSDHSGMADLLEELELSIALFEPSEYT